MNFDIKTDQLDGDVYVIDKFKTAWLKDPDGNILSIVSG